MRKHTPPLLFWQGQFNYAPIVIHLIRLVIGFSEIQDWCHSIIMYECTHSLHNNYKYITQRLNYTIYDKGERKLPRQEVVLLSRVNKKMTINFTERIYNSDFLRENSPLAPLPLPYHPSKCRKQTANVENRDRFGFVDRRSLNQNQFFIADCILDLAKS